MYYEGDGVSQDKAKAPQLYQQAAEQGEPLSQGGFNIEVQRRQI